MTSDLSLSPAEARVLGVLIEKSMTTPEQYPLSLNALVNGCNQKSNRDPGLELDAKATKAAIRGLREKQLAVEIWPPTGSRTEKYRHLAEAGFGIDTRQAAVLGELLLRRAQMPGELRTRVSRMVPIDSQGELKQILEDLIQQGLVRRLDPAPGSRAERYDHLLCGEPTSMEPPSAPSASSLAPHKTVPNAASAPAVPAASPGLHEILERLAALEARVTELERSATES